MTEQHDPAPQFNQPPNGIAAEQFTLDGVLFVPHPDGRMENASRDGVPIGDVLIDDDRFWFARKPDVQGEWADWKPMRCVHEARAFIVSSKKQ